MKGLEAIPYVEILGIRIRHTTLADCLHLCAKTIIHHDQLRISPCNLEILMRARVNPLLREYLNSSLTIADGVPLLWASRLLNRPLPERVSGTDLVYALCEQAARYGWKVYLLGSEPEINQRAQACLRTLYPELQVTGDGPPIDLDNASLNEAIAQKVREAGTQLLFVGLGTPKQELWLRNYLERTGAYVGMSMGGALDIISGRYKRAPRWMRQHGFEWLFRLTQQPGYLWKRYLSNLAFFWYLAGQFLSERFFQQRVKRE